LIKDNPAAKGVLLGHHGVSSWNDDDKACYETALEIVDRAARYIERHDRGEMTFGGPRYNPLPEEARREIFVEILPWLRGRLSADKRQLATMQDDPRMLRFVCSADGPRLAELGTSCPDHFLRTKIKPLFIDWDPKRADVAALEKAIEDGVSRYRADYAKYYERNRRSDSPPMRDASPTVVLIPGLGMIAWGKTKSESRVTAEFYNGAIEVMRGAEAIDRYKAMDEREAFDIEYWSLEEAKLRRLPVERELDRRVIAIVGAGSGIGKAAAHRLANAGAHLVSADLDESMAKTTAREILKQHGEGIGVAGTGISNCGPAVGLVCDITNRASVERLMRDAILAYGGLDAVVITAGVFTPDKTSSQESGESADGNWARTFAINVTGAHAVAEEANRIFERQGLPASLVLTTSANAVVAKKGSIAYDTSKAAANHLVRELAVSMSPLVRVNAVAPATVVKGSTMFPRERVIDSLKKYGLAFGEEESTDELRDRLASFYAGRSLLALPIEPEDQAEAIFLLVSNRLSKTTGHVIPVDGGLQDGFLR
jgi:rhamnulose-1-phosphate aldolase/alcohol dehydrogenase